MIKGGDLFSGVQSWLLPYFLTSVYNILFQSDHWVIGEILRFAACIHECKRSLLHCSSFRLSVKAVMIQNIVITVGSLGYIKGKPSFLCDG